MTIRKLLCAAAVLAVVAPAAFSATGDIALPTWPQSFKLHPGQVSVFGFPITRAGNAVVDLNWTGNDLAVQLVDSSAGSTPTVTGAVKTLAASDKHSAPKAHLTLALTPTQVAHSNIWYISVTCLGTGHMPVDPRTPPQPEALGTITITYPSVDQALLQPKLKALVLTRQTALSAVHPAGPKPITFQARLAAHNKLLNDRIAALTKLLTTRMKANVASADTARVALTRVTLRHLPSTGPSLHNVTFGPGFKGGLGTKLTGGAHPRVGPTHHRLRHPCLGPPWR